MCRGAGLSTAAGVPGWGWGEKETVWFACPGVWWRQPKTGENVSQPRDAHRDLGLSDIYPGCRNTGWSTAVCERLGMGAVQIGPLKRG